MKGKRRKEKREEERRIGVGHTGVALCAHGSREEEKTLRMHRMTYIMHLILFAPQLLSTSVLDGQSKQQICTWNDALRGRGLTSKGRGGLLQ